MPTRSPVAWPSTTGGASAGVLTKKSTSSSTFLPVQVARSSLVGPKPARQNNRSTIASVSTASVGVGDGDGAGDGDGLAVGSGAGVVASGAGAGAVVTGAMAGTGLVVGVGELGLGTLTRTLGEIAPAFLRAS